MCKWTTLNRKFIYKFALCFTVRPTSYLWFYIAIHRYLAMGYGSRAYHFHLLIRFVVWRGAIRSKIRKLMLVDSVIQMISWGNQPPFRLPNILSTISYKEDELLLLYSNIYSDSVSNLFRVEVDLNLSDPINFCYRTSVRVCPKSSLNSCSIITKYH